MCIDYIHVDKNNAELHNTLQCGTLKSSITNDNLGDYHVRFPEYKRMRLYSDISAPPLISACA